MKAFIGADKVLSKEHSKILENPAFSGCYPKIVDKVFFLERFATELQGKSAPVKDTKRTGNGVSDVTDQHEAFRPTGFTSFEHSLICINITLVIGIALTIIVLGLFFFFLNSALYLKEEIS